MKNIKILSVIKETKDLLFQLKLRQEAANLRKNQKPQKTDRLKIF